MGAVRIVSIFLIIFAGLCWIGAAFVGISNAGADADAGSVGLMNMFTGGGTTSALLAIAMGIWLKE